MRTHIKNILFPPSCYTQSISEAQGYILYTILALVEQYFCLAGERVSVAEGGIAREKDSGGWRIRDWIFVFCQEIPFEQVI